MTVLSTTKGAFVVYVEKLLKSVSSFTWCSWARTPGVERARLGTVSILGSMPRTGNCWTPSCRLASSIAIYALNQRVCSCTGEQRQDQHEHTSEFYVKSLLGWAFEDE